MGLTQEAIDELKQICKKELDIELSDQEAWDMGINLVNLFKAIAESQRSLHQRKQSKDNSKPRN
ncbi:MAG: hypothetical protein PHC97_00870 [Patescibacteria group bacterium]|nr:hypothetical protein [Patescibacteria group bacterium]